MEEERQDQVEKQTSQAEKLKLTKLRSRLAKLNKRQPAKLNHSAWKKGNKIKLKSRQAKLSQTTKLMMREMMTKLRSRQAELNHSMLM